LKKVFPLTVQNLLNPKQEKEHIFKKKVLDEGRIYSKEGFRRRKDIFKRRFSYYHWGKLSPHVETFPLPQSKVMRWRILIFNKV
jgi:elongation factor P hydroxylase